MLLALIPALLAADPIQVEVRVLSTPTSGVLYLRGTGDLNGDGLDDVLAGTVDSPLTLWYGGAHDAPVYLFADDTLHGEHFGVDGSSGDLNGDGFDDIIIGSSDYTAYPIGAFYVWSGGPAGIDPLSWVRVESPGAFEFDSFGLQLQVVGDLDGDGDEELAVSAPQDSTSGYTDGAVWLFEGGEVPGPAQLLTAQNDDDEPLWFGFDTVPGGDVNGDGHPDLLIASLVGRAPERYIAHLYLGGPEGIDQASAQVTTLSGLLPHLTGSFDAVTGGTDLDQDGFADAALAGLGEGEEDVVHVLHGSALGFDEQRQISRPTPLNGWQLWAFTLSSPGDLNGDGAPELLVSEDGSLGWLLLGDTSRDYALAPLEGELPDDLDPGPLGGAAGDVDGDGVNELLINAYAGAEREPRVLLATVLPPSEDSGLDDTGLDGSDAPKGSCGCASAPPPPWSGALALLALVGLRRRR